MVVGRKSHNGVFYTSSFDMKSTLPPMLIIIIYVRRIKALRHLWAKNAVPVHLKKTSFCLLLIF